MKRIRMELWDKLVISIFGFPSYARGNRYMTDNVLTLVKDRLWYKNHNQVADQIENEIIE